MTDSLQAAVQRGTADGDGEAQPSTASPEVNESLARVLRSVYTGEARTRPEVIAATGLGRTVVTQRVDLAIALGLLADDGLAASTGGRSARELRFRDEAGRILVAVFGAEVVHLGITDLHGAILVSTTKAWDIAQGPQASLEFSADQFGALLGEVGPETPVWGAAIGLPGPVEFATGRPVSPPIMPGWDAYDIRGWIEDHFQIPVWVDNDVNLMALGEFMHGPDVDENMLFVEVGTGIGAGIIVRGELLRGAKGAAGDIGHVESADSALTCRCGQVGCLETVAAGWALARDASTELERGASSPMLSSRFAREGRLIGEDVAGAAAMGDPLALRLVERSARTVGETLASVINILNPAVVVIGGSIARTGDRFLAPVRESIYRRSLPLATRDLRIVPASLGRQQELIGGASLVSSRLLALGSLERWGTRGTPLSMERERLYATAGY